MIKLVQYDYIRFLYFNEGLSKREIAKRVNVHRNTVTRAIENEDNSYNLTVENKQPVNGPYKDRITIMV
ncbi:helix-turn-helix domain-containing protein [Clostridium sp. D2Q-11]|uniref:Helix-turn-helix domain-containing protein n=1 Tax=Anaeromonas frigoriresistens TaxID=2683708 RepID=A0A942UUF9_9FIRM|nr:helix-turn-helix domain-containing protein [Anaeromonas frigoriresistens]MBS4536989.1 helix-turn-helix domain-containing protein [Anaeromonas frigoriresistens]